MSPPDEIPMHQNVEFAELSPGPSVQPEDAADLRGRMYRAKRMMPDEEAKAFLPTHKVAHVGTVDANGSPYVIPLICIY